MYPKLTYTEALLISGLDTLHARRENITRDLFREIKDGNHIPHSLLPKKEITSIAVRNLYPYKISITKVFRYGRGLIPYCIANNFKYNRSILFYDNLFHSYLLFLAL